MGMRLAAAALGAALVITTLPARGADKETDTVVRGELGQRLDAAVGEGFWGSVLVARDGEILLAKGYGSADYGKTPNTPATLHELASASKQVAAAAILHLQQKRKLSVTDPLGRFFDKVPEDKRAITLHHLLTHTSGLSGSIGVPYASTVPRERYVEQMLAAPPASAPGTKFEYCNAGYALLAAVVEEVAKGSFESYCEKNLFAPAGMKRTGFIGDKDLVRSPDVSSRKGGGIPNATAANWHWGWGYRGMGGVVTSVHDLLRWDRALRGDKILGKDAKDALYTPALEKYAYGWRVEATERGTRKASHSGSVAGYGTNVVRYLEDDVVVFVLGNDPAAAHRVTGALESLLFEPVPMEALVDASPYPVGQYRNSKIPASAVWEARRERDELVLTLKDGKHVALELKAPRAFAAKLTTDLEAAIATRRADDDGGAAAIEAEIFLGRYPAGPRHVLRQGLTARVDSEYRGQGADGEPVVDRRVLFVLVDSVHGQWPVMAKMNVAAATDLLEKIRRAS